MATRNGTFRSCFVTDPSVDVRLCLTTQPLAQDRARRSLARRAKQAMPSLLGPSARRGIGDAAPRRPEGDNSKRQRTPQPVDVRRGCQKEPRRRL